MPTPEEIRDMEHKHLKMSYNQISDLIYAGNNMCCQTHFEEELLAKGITADISLESERLDQPQGINYFIWLPWQEDTAPSRELIEVGLDIVNQLIRHKIKVYIHCKNGHGRTTSFLIAYLINRDKVSVEQALDLVRGERPSMHINQNQISFLKETEYFLKER